MVDPMTLPFSPLRIGDVTVSLPVALAPMAGYTDAPFRAACGRCGCEMTFTEVVNAQGIVHDSQRTLNLLATGPDEITPVAHIYGSEPAVMAGAAAAVEKLGRFRMIDINAGCPVRKIVSKGAGVALMRDPGLLKEIVAAVAGAVSLPVTVKTRIGLDPDRVNVFEVTQAIEEGGASAVIVHARLASDRHAGPADWDMLARVKQERTIPVLGNGGIVTAGDAVEMLRRTGVDGVMVARAAVGNPWIFAEIRALLTGTDYAPPTVEARRAVIVAHLEHLIALRTQEWARWRRRAKRDPEGVAVRGFRPHLLRYLAGLPGTGLLRRSLNDMACIDDVLRAVDRASPLPHP